MASPLDEIRAVSALEVVVAGSTAEGVVTASALEGVMAVPAAECVVACSSEESILMASPCDEIRSAPAAECVVTASALEGVVAVIAAHHKGTTQRAGINDVIAITALTLDLLDAVELLALGPWAFDHNGIAIHAQSHRLSAVIGVDVAFFGTRADIQQ